MLGINFGDGWKLAPDSQFTILYYTTKCRCRSFKIIIPTSYPPIARDAAEKPSASLCPRFDFIIHKSICPLNSECLYSRKFQLYFSRSSAQHKAHTWRQSRGIELSLGVWMPGWALKVVKLLRSAVKCYWLTADKSLPETWKPWSGSCQASSSYWVDGKDCCYDIPAASNNSLIHWGNYTPTSEECRNYDAVEATDGCFGRLYYCHDHFRKCALDWEDHTLG